MKARDFEQEKKLRTGKAPKAGFSDFEHENKGGAAPGASVVPALL